MRLAATVFIVLTWISGGLGAQPVETLADGRSGDIEFTSFDPPGHNALALGSFDRTPVKIGGKLSFPGGDAKVPAIVIGYTVGGLKPVLYSRWAKSLNDAGYATLVVDSFGPRGMHQMWTKGLGAFKGGGSFLTADAFRSLALLATHPRIDPDRIAFVGFSMGGGVANTVLHERFRRAVLGDVPLQFAASVSHYPPCHYNFVEDKPSSVPLFLFLAEKDDWTPAPACQEYGELLSSRGYKVTTKVYEGAGHGYDEDLASKYQDLVTSRAACNPLVVNLDEPILAPRFMRGGAALAPGADTRAAAIGVYKWDSACTTKGGTLGVSPGNGDRREDAVRDTIKVLDSAMKPRS
jgi:dienelactone hydrolase